LELLLLELHAVTLRQTEGVGTPTRGIKTPVTVFVIKNNKTKLIGLVVAGKYDRLGGESDFPTLNSEIT